METYRANGAKSVNVSKLRYVIYPNSKTPKNPIWGITIHDNDRYILEWVKDTIGVGKQISHTRNESVLTITSKKMVDDLAKYGVVPRKSFKTFFPDHIPKELNRHLIRGIFDGDGCISNHIFSIYGNKKLLEGIMETLIEDLNLQPHKITTRETNGADSFSYSSKKDLAKIFHYLYDDASVCLERKYNKMKNYKEKDDYVI